MHLLTGMKHSFPKYVQGLRVITTRAPLYKMYTSIDRELSKGGI
jgi:hypothetical protein